METQETNSMAQANANYDSWKDARDVDKALRDFCKRKPTHKYTELAIADMKDFAKFYAHRCGVQLDGECEHPYHSVVGGGGKPERCLKCGRVLSD